MIEIEIIMTAYSVSFKDDASKSGKVVLGRGFMSLVIRPCLRNRERCAGSPGDLLLPPSPPAEKATAFRMKIALNYLWR
jgi:hypothetical protein